MYNPYLSDEQLDTQALKFYAQNYDLIAFFLWFLTIMFILVIRNKRDAVFVKSLNQGCHLNMLLT